MQPCNRGTQLAFLGAPVSEARDDLAYRCDLLFTQYNAAIHLGPFDKSERNGIKASELHVRAVFGRIIQISTHAAPADTLTGWFSHVCNSECYKQEVALGNRHDLAVITQYLGDRIADGIGWDTKQQKQRDDFCSSNLSTVVIVQLNTPVSQRAIQRLYRFDMNGQRLIGLAPELAQESDHICVLQGARVPFIVRETSEAGKYTLVGETLAENFMLGQLQSFGGSIREITLV